jgi:hypothetical protein
MVVLLLESGAQVRLNCLRVKERGMWQERTTLQIARMQGGRMLRVVEQAVEQQRQKGKSGS